MSPRKSILLLLAAGAGARADLLSLGSASAPPDSTVLVPVDLVKSSPVTGVQFELRYPDSHVTAGPPTLANASNHVVRAEQVAPGRQRVVVYSPTHAEMPSDLRIRLTAVLGAQSPAGGPSLALENILFAGTDGEFVPAGITYTFMEDWRRRRFSQAQRDDPAQVGDDRDPDGDGPNNLVEALVGGNPLAADAARTGRSHLYTDGQGRLQFALRFFRTRDPAALAELNTGVEASANLADWSPTGVVVAPTGAQDAEGEELEARVEVSPHAIRALHVFVERKDSPP